MTAKSKSLLCLAMVLAMIFTLAGCAAESPTGGDNGGGGASTPADNGGDNSGDNGGGDPEPTEEVPLTPEELAAKHNEIYDRYPAKDLGGRVITAVGHFEYFPKTVDGLLVEPDPSEDDYYTKMATYLNVKRITEKYNCQLDMVVMEFTQSNAQLVADAIGGKPSFDIIVIDPQLISGPILQGLILPLSEVAGPFTDVMTDQYYVKSQGSFLGAEYFVPDQTIEHDENGNEVRSDGQAMGYNKSIIASLNLEDPRTLYDNGKWTWDKFLEMCNTVTKSSTGTEQLWGYTGPPVPFGDMIIASNGGYMLDSATNKAGLDDPKTIKALEIMDKMFNVDKVYGLCAGGEHDWWGNWIEFRNGKSAFFEYRPWLLDGWEERDNFDIGIVPFPQGPDSTNDKASWFRSTGGVAIVKGIEDPDIVYQIWEEFKIPYATADTIDLDHNPYAWVESTLTDEKDVLMFTEVCVDGYIIDNASCISGMTDELSRVYSEIVNGNMTVAQAIETYKQTVQDRIDAVVNQ